MRPCGHLQVVVSRAGNVTVTGTVELTCPTASSFVDSYGGLYGRGSYLADSKLCESFVLPFQVVVSTLSFGCTPCGVSTYSLQQGRSNGTAGVPGAITCLPCPFGGVCTNGSVGPSAGFWGAALADGSGHVAFIQCPGGYCCAGSTVGGLCTVTAQAGCAGHRVGVLCGDCTAGYVESLGSSACTRTASCAVDMPGVWVAMVAAVFTSAVLQLTLVSGVWFGSADAPTGKMKLMIYYFQVGGRDGGRVTVGPCVVGMGLKPLPILPTPRTVTL